jgi:hypothetical protein
MCHYRVRNGLQEMFVIEIFTDVYTVSRLRDDNGMYSFMCMSSTSFYVGET